MTDFRPGDRVRVTFETKVRPNGTFFGHSREGHTVELIERADDPSKDPTGTKLGMSQARNPSGSSLGTPVRTATVASAVACYTATSLAGRSSELSAETQQAERPLWTGDGSEEPPEYVTKVRWHEFDPMRNCTDTARRVSNGKWRWSHERTGGRFSFADLTTTCPGTYTEVRDDE